MVNAFAVDPQPAFGNDEGPPVVAADLAHLDLGHDALVLGQNLATVFPGQGLPQRYRYKARVGNAVA